MTKRFQKCNLIGSPVIQYVYYNSGFSFSRCLQILKLCPKKKSSAAYTFCKAMGLLGMQFHLFENECTSQSLHNTPYNKQCFGLLENRQKLPQVEVNKGCILNNSVSSVLPRLPSRHHHPLTFWLRQEAGT